MAYVGPGAGAASAGSVLVLLLTVALILMPFVGAIVLVAWVLIERRKTRRAAST